MFKIRAFEEEANRLFVQGLIQGSIHTYIGQEAIAAGFSKNLSKSDYLITTHRGHGHCIAKGGNMDRMYAELMGKSGGYCRGKGGSMHIADLNKGILGAISIVGAGIPIAVGAGLSIKKRKTDQVSVVFFGDGAANQGEFHEGMNLAALWRLPVVFVCENNGYAASVSAKRASSVDDLAARAVGYGIPGVIVDGMDVFDVYDKSWTAIERARKGVGPSFLECKTYRYLGHSRGDPPAGLYRTKEEVEEWTNRDAIKRLKTGHHVDDADASNIAARVFAEIQAAVKFARESPPPLPETAFTEVYA
ncbi:MAG: thiamine pyrophosphate-dependent dehydrogenase E1 component subunit alpha [Candidatus Bathyarchaeia archaeon]